MNLHAKLTIALSQIDQRLIALDAADEVLAMARAELAKLPPDLAHIDHLLYAAAQCLMQRETA